MILNLLIILALLIFITLVVIVIKNSKSSKDTSYPHQKEMNDSQSTYWTESFKVQSDEKRKDMIDAEKIGFLKLSLKDDGLIDLKHQLNLSNIQMDVLIQEAPKSLNRLIIDFGCVYDHDGDEDVRYVPVELSTESVTLNFETLKKPFIFIWIVRHLSFNKTNLNLYGNTGSNQPQNHLYLRQAG